MDILSRDTLPLGGFAGLREHRLVTDSRVFGGNKAANTFEGLGNFVYLADAQFNPHGETGMHPHKEIDVISVMIDGRISHEGSLEHGKGLVAGDVQVQRAGGEGFAHNEVNPDDTKNRMIQLWVVPDEKGQPAGYKHYSPAQNAVTHIYGGNTSNGHEVDDTFDNHTNIDVAVLSAGLTHTLEGQALVYVTDGEVVLNENTTGDVHTATDGDLIRGVDLSIEAKSEARFIIIR